MQCAFRGAKGLLVPPKTSLKSVRHYPPQRGRRAVNFLHDLSVHSKHVCVKFPHAGVHAVSFQSAARAMTAMPIADRAVGPDGKPTRSVLVVDGDRRVSSFLDRALSAAG